MWSKIIKQEGNKLIVQTEIELDDTSLLNSEELIQQAVNEIGNTLTGHAIKKMDTDGSAIKVAGKKMTSKGLEKKI